MNTELVTVWTGASWRQDRLLPAPAELPVPGHRLNGIVSEAVRVALEQHGPLTAMQIVRLTGMPESGVRMALHRFARRGWIQVAPEPDRSSGKPLKAFLWVRERGTR